MRVDARILPMGRLDELDLSLSLSRTEEAERLSAAQRRLLELRLHLAGLTGDGRLGPPVCVLFEGWDASGKGGAIKRLVTMLDARHVRVAQFAAPTHDEKRHHFLGAVDPRRGRVQALRASEGGLRDGRADRGRHARAGLRAADAHLRRKWPAPEGRRAQKRRSVGDRGRLLRPRGDGLVRALRTIPVLAAFAVAAGCSQSEPAIPPACLQGQGAVTGALRSAPGAVSFADGTRLSACIERADSGAELQEVGTSYVGVASTLAEAVPRSDAAALQLGYLVGATRRGAANTNGTGIELLRRVEATIGIDGPPPSRRAAYARGLAAGHRAG